VGADPPFNFQQRGFFGRAFSSDGAKVGHFHGVYFSCERGWPEWERALESMHS
jgi:hypothetical protein